MDLTLSKETLLLAELDAIGYQFKDINDIHKQKSIPADVVKKILKWLPEIYEEHLGSGEHLVRALISAKDPFDPKVLIYLFEKGSYNSTIKWTIAYVLSISKTYDISNLIRNKLLHEKSSFERSGFLYGLTTKMGLRTAEELMLVLRELFDKYFYFETYRKIFKKFATLGDIDFLQDKIKNPQLSNYLDYRRNADEILSENKIKDAPKRFEKEVLKLIGDIKKRKVIHKFPPGK